MTDTPVKVLYITGFERSGSTILQNVLGQVEGFTAIGEARYIWDELKGGATLCGCGARVGECEFWKGIMSTGFAEPGRIPLREVMKQRERKQRDMIPMLLGWDQALKRRMKDYLGCIETVYQAVRRVTGSRIIIDASKSPLYGYTLGLAGSLDVRALHLVRDPRGVATSIVRRKAKGHPGYQDWHVTRVAFSWTVWNTAIGLLWRKKRTRLMRIRYEDFMESPRAALEKILAFVGGTAHELPLLDENTVILESTHTIGGSPSRFKLGSVKLEPDRQWESQLTTGQRMALMPWTFPLRRWYGY